MASLWQPSSITLRQETDAPVQKHQCSDLDSQMDYLGWEMVWILYFFRLWTSCTHMKSLGWTQSVFHSSENTSLHLQYADFLICRALRDHSEPSFICWDMQNSTQTVMLNPSQIQTEKVLPASLPGGWRCYAGQAHGKLIPFNSTQVPSCIRVYSEELMRHAPSHMPR